jgi:hypothetical protein
MSTRWETFFRSAGTVALFSLLVFLSNQTNLTGILPDGIAALVATIAAVIDKAYSPDGTVVFGTFGVRK